MNITVQSQDIKITKSLRQFILKQTQKFNKLGQKISKININLEKLAKKDKEPAANKVKYQISIPGKPVLVIKRGAADMYAAIVDTTQAALRQVRKTKERRLTKREKRS